jgi:hypothetical protein
MTAPFDIDELMGLWATPPATDDAALALVRSLYTDPVVINGARFTAVELVARIRALQDACSDLRHEVIERVDTPGKLAVAFVLRGVHTGPLETPLGPVAATGRPFEARVIDVLTLVDGRIAVITMVADELGRLLSLGAVRLA